MSQLDLSLGALEIGALFSSTLWGVTTVQFYTYLTTPNKDPLWTKILVRIFLANFSVHTICVWIYIYRLTVTFYGIPAVLGETHWSLDISSLFDVIIGALTIQMYFAYRIRSFSKSWPITLVSWLGSLLQLASGMGITIVSGRVSLAEFGVRFDWLVEAILSINLVVDLINTSGLIYYLQRERTGTDVILQKLVMWTIGASLFLMLFRLRFV
ncbi:hypothetical protein DFH06DRAFT_978485 [Mycena polygramma]|nr:hypothetical protein DFH06DRAFT_978485 [Mycena polygramma]